MAAKGHKSQHIDDWSSLGASKVDFPHLINMIYLSIKSCLLSLLRKNVGVLCK